MKTLIYICVIAFFASCNNMADQAAEKTEAANKDRMQQFFDKVVNAHNVDMLDSFCTADFVNHNPDPGHSGQGIDDLKATFKEFFAGFPDIKMTPDFMVAEGDKVSAHMTMTGTNTGSMGPNMPATGKSINVEAIDVVKFKDGKASERWGFGDVMKMMGQLGMMPPPGAPPAPPAEPMKMKEKKK